MLPASTTRTFVELLLWLSDLKMALAYLHKFLEAAGEVDAILRAPLEVRKIVIFKTRSLIKSHLFKAFCHILAAYCGDVTKYARDWYKIVV